MRPELPSLFYLSSSLLVAFLSILCLFVFLHFALLRVVLGLEMLTQTENAIPSTQGSRGMTNSGVRAGVL